MEEEDTVSPVEEVAGDAPAPETLGVNVVENIKAGEAIG